jgi:hypothetical protein
MLGENDPEQGPATEVPYDLENYWRWRQKASEWRHYSFRNPGKVRTLRFVELCRKYGYGNRRVRDQATPPVGCKAADRAEIAVLSDIAAG